MSRRSEVCRNCSPHGGAFFDRAGIYSDDFELIGWQKQCRNCGATKKIRRSTMPSFIEVTETLTHADKLSAKNTALFHYFNPHGALTAKKASDDRIDAAVKAGIMKNGAIIAYGYLNDFHQNSLYKLTQQKRPRRWNVDYHVSGLLKDAKKADEYVASTTAESETATKGENR